MSKYVIDDTTLTAIGDAVREKGGTTELIPVSELADAITNLPSGGGGAIDWSSVTNFVYFSYMNNRNELVKKLRYADTSNGIEFGSMLYGCSNLVEIPRLDTSNGTVFRQMFRNCSGLVKLPDLDTSKGTEFNGMFNGCSNLVEIPRLDTSSCTGSLGSLFKDCSKLVEIPRLDTSKCTDFNAMFSGCKSLVEIPELDTSSCDGANSKFTSTFSSCSALKNIQFTGTFNIVKDLVVFSSSPNLTVESIVSFLNALSDNTGLETTYKVTIGSTNLRKLTQEQKQIAYDKNLTLA